MGISLVQRNVVVFDFDGTIADTSDSIIATATTVLTGWGLRPDELSRDRVSQIIGPPFPQAYEQVFGLSHDDAVEVTRRYRSIYTQLGVEAWPAFPGIVELLEQLRDAGRKLAVASSKSASLVMRGLVDNGIDGLFDTVCAKDSDDRATKVDSILLALDKLGARAQDAVMVGDRFHDVEAASACGMPCVGVLYGHTAERSELEGAGAAVVADTVDDLRRYLLG